MLKTIQSRKAYTFAELLIASVIVVVIISSAIAIFVVTKTVYATSIFEYNLQRNANVLVNEIIRGVREPGGAYGLRGAQAYTLPVVSPAGSRIDYTHMDGLVRSFFLSGNSIIYQSPTISPNQRTLLTIPAGATATLRFWKPAGFMDNETVGVYLSISQTVGNRTGSGSLSTYVNLRNIPK